jgi:hypothetical protein
MVGSWCCALHNQRIETGEIPPLSGHAARSRLTTQPQGGYTTLDLRASGITAREIRSVGVEIWSVTEMLEAGYSVSDVFGDTSSSSSSISSGGISSGGHNSKSNAGVHDADARLSSPSQMLAHHDSQHSSHSDFVALQFDLKSM